MLNDDLATLSSNKFIQNCGISVVQNQSIFSFLVKVTDWKDYLYKNLIWKWLLITLLSCGEKCNRFLEMYYIFGL